MAGNKSKYTQEMREQTVNHILRSGKQQRARGGFENRYEYGMPLSEAQRRHEQGGRFVVDNSCLESFLRAGRKNVLR